MRTSRSRCSWPSSGRLPSCSAAIRSRAGKLMRMTGSALALGLSLAAGGVAEAMSSDSVEEWLAFLNSPEGRQERQLQEARQDEQFTNRLNVVFETDASPDRRSRVLREVGSQFLAILLAVWGREQVYFDQRSRRHLLAAFALKGSVTPCGGP